VILLCATKEIQKQDTEQGSHYCSSIFINGEVFPTLSFSFYSWMYHEHKKEESARQLEALNLETENQEMKKCSVDCSSVHTSQNGKDLTKVHEENEMNVVVTTGGVENKAFIVEDSNQL
jgi:hypothetical protein